MSDFALVAAVIFVPGLHYMAADGLLFNLYAWFQLVCFGGGMLVIWLGSAAKLEGKEAEMVHAITGGVMIFIGMLAMVVFG